MTHLFASSLCLPVVLIQTGLAVPAQRQRLPVPVPRTHTTLESKGQAVGQNVEKR